jgi:DNA invertase Pin-like site-specific DNA recombinase
LNYWNRGKKMDAAVAYYRTSSATNVDGDSLDRQKQTIDGFAKSQGFEVVNEFYDAAVSGADPIDQRPGFAKLLDYIAGNGAKIILVENASRFARDLAIQLTGHELLKKLGYELIPVDAPDHFIDETPTAVMVRQILGAVSQFEKAQVVQKLKAARDRKRALTGKCEGRKSYQELDMVLVREAKRLARKNPKSGKKRSLRKIGQILYEMDKGWHTSSGKPFGAQQVQNLLV